MERFLQVLFNEYILETRNVYAERILRTIFYKNKLSSDQAHNLSSVQFGPSVSCFEGVKTNVFTPHESTQAGKENKWLGQGLQVRGRGLGNLAKFDKITLPKVVWKI